MPEIYINFGERQPCGATMAGPGPSFSLVNNSIDSFDDISMGKILGRIYTWL
jgi:hypothetical protein